MKDLSILSQINAIVKHAQRNNIVLQNISVSKDGQDVYGYIKNESSYITVWSFIDNDYLESLSDNYSNYDNIQDARY